MNKQTTFVHGNWAWKRILSFCMALVLVLALLPASVLTAEAAAIEGGTTLYLLPNNNWKIDGARFAAYFFGAGETWVSMTDADGDGYYEVTVPAGGYTHVIFCRMTPSDTANNWTNKWNQTADLTVESGKNCYTVAEGTWDKGNGEWSYYAPVVETEPTVPSEPVTPSGKDYYLIGYIDGANYGDGDDYANMGDYKFVNGSVTVTFKQTSYVCVKDTDMVWYMTDGWLGSVTSATLYNTADLDSTADKLMVPAGTVTFMLVVNADGTLTLSYTTGGTTDPSEPDPTEPSEPVGPGTVPVGDFFLFGYIDGANYNGFDYKFVNGQVKAQFSQDSYVYILRQNDGKEFMTDGWQGEVSSALLYSSAVTGNKSDKLFVPGGVEVTFTLEEVQTDVYRLSYTYEGAGSADDYYLFGYINGADYGVGGPSTYKFTDGTLTTTFPSDSYVGVKTGDNSVKYFTNGWLGAVTTATLYNNVPVAKQDKMMVPGGVEVTFTLKVNNDGSCTLSYVRKDDPGVKDTSGIQDGLTLHCWNWSYVNIEANMAKIAEMGYTAIQTSPAQVMKEATIGKPYSDNWWVFYQPVDFKMNTATDNALGTKAQFESMCRAADKYGIKIIVDVVANHLGNERGNDLSSKIPSNIRNNAAFWHDYTKNTTNYRDRYDITQHCMAGLPDLNTGNKELQNIILGYLKECIDAGADGFRFDATKHIETPEDDASYASDFWPTVVGGAEKYAMDTYGMDLYCYGELLDNPGGDKLPILAYTKHLAVTDNSWSNCLRQDLAAGNNGYNIKGYNKAALPSQLVLWAESHDTYSTSESGLNSAATSTAVLHKTWALVAARKDAMSLYFVRPDSFTTAGTKLGEASLNTGWASDEVKAINKFHNAFVGQSEAVSNSGSISYVERGTSGVVLVNAAGTTANVDVPAKAMADGTYTDQITGNTFTVSGGKISGEIGSTGIAVVYNAPEGEHTHRYTAVVTAPTCTEEGYTTYTCACGDSYIDDVTEAAGHKYQNDGVCENCGDIMTLSNVTITKTLGHSTGIILYWDAVENGDIYQIYRLNGSSWELLKNTRSLAYKDETALPGVKHYYKIVARNGNMKSDIKTTVSTAAVRPAANLANVVINKAVGHTTGNILYWDAVDGAKLYQVYRLDSGAWTLLKNTGSLAYKDETAPVGVKSYYKIVARNGEIKSDIAATASTGVVRPAAAVTKLDNVTITQIKPHSTGNILYWNAVENAKVYQVYRLENGSWVLLKNTGSLAYKDETAPVGVKCYYKIVARNGDVKSDIKTTASASATRP